MSAQRGGDARPKTSATWYAADIKCPFFRAHSRTEIRCEGFVEQSSTGMLFQRPSDKLRQQHDYCEREYTKCEIYRALMSAKYDD